MSVFNRIITSHPHVNISITTRILPECQGAVCYSLDQIDFLFSVTSSLPLGGFQSLQSLKNIQSVLSDEGALSFRNSSVHFYTMASVVKELFLTEAVWYSLGSGCAHLFTAFFKNVLLV